MAELHDLSALEQGDLVRHREVSPAELTEHYLERAHRLDDVGAFVTLMLYGVLPLSIVLYLLGTPMRRRARQRAEAAQQAQAELAAPPSSPQGDGSSHAAGAVLAPERKEP